MEPVSSCRHPDASSPSKLFAAHAIAYGCHRLARTCARVSLLPLYGCCCCTCAAVVLLDLSSQWWKTVGLEETQQRLQDTMTRHDSTPRCFFTALHSVQLSHFEGLEVRRVEGGRPSRKAGRCSREGSRMTTVADRRGASRRHCSDAADMCSSSHASTCRVRKLLRREPKGKSPRQSFSRNSCNARGAAWGAGVKPLASTAVAARYRPSNRTRRSAPSLLKLDGSSTFGRRQSPDSRRSCRRVRRVMQAGSMLLPEAVLGDGGGASGSTSPSPSSTKSEGGGAKEAKSTSSFSKLTRAPSSTAGRSGRSMVKGQACSFSVSAFSCVSGARPAARAADTRQDGAAGPVRDSSCSCLSCASPDRSSCSLVRGSSRSRCSSRL
mmetsp:Transcript_4525/g.13006  ORF Transcript_4525/g.13006 Transcript_4525/m.13006 type:complete len:380 (+) Transcript_4525:611-1750(+)